MSLNKILTKDKALELKEEHWIPLSDLMTGLMMIFMLIAIIFMVKVENNAEKIKNNAEKIKEVAFIYDAMKSDLYTDLNNEFQHDLATWGAELDKDLTFRFKEPNILFDNGQEKLKPQFISILDNFFPRYIKILSNKKYKESIEEIRIEGHTSSIWAGSTNPNEAYFLNMELSQARTRTTLQYVLTLNQLEGQQSWLKSHLTANGLSSSKLIYNTDGTENKDGSQRVEFRVRTNADTKISEILKMIQQ